MDPITAGAIFLLGFAGNTLAEWTLSKAFDVVYEKAKQVLQEKSPEIAAQAALPPAEREDIGEAVLIEEVKKAAAADPEIKEAVEALGNQVNQAAEANPELKKAIAELTAAIKAQSPTKKADTIGIEKQENRDNSRVYNTTSGNIIIHEARN
ncbi:MAG: hypothetical protein HEQ19_19515 [Gloeotrichia echinulata CP02]|jgi:hypothetical protein